MASSVATRITFVAAALLILFSILVRQVNHDEGQYVAAIAMMRHGWPYLDFPYLQTPLQPLLLSPLSALPAGWLLVAARLANGLFAFATLVFIYVAVRDRVERRSALIAIVAVACTEAFMMASALARNDTLPMMLLAGAIVALLRAVDRKADAPALAIAGLLLGLATSAKISAAVPAAGAALFLLLHARQFGHRGLVAFGIGAIVGFLPTIALALAAPAQFRFDVFTYSLEAPRQWWTATGWSVSFLFVVRVAILLALSAQGAIPPALAAAVIDRRRSDDRLLLNLMIVGGLIGAYMPEPPFVQYLVPLLPPLFVRFALAIDGPRRPWHRPVFIVAAICTIAGLSNPIIHTVRTFKRGGTDLGYAIQQGHEVARLANGGTIVTLSSEIAAGSDANLDRGFTTGPFLYRTFGALSADALRYGYSPNWERVEQALGARAPAVIFVGREMKQRKPSILLHGHKRPRAPFLPTHLDAPLVAWAQAHAYVKVLLANGSFAFVRPPCSGAVRRISSGCTGEFPYTRRPPTSP